jgi:hypothetical protein
MKPFHLTGTDAFGEEMYLICPTCGFEYVHPIRVKVATGDGVTVIENKETRYVQRETAEVLQAKKNCGVRILLEYVCESGDHGNIILQFHEGITYFEHERLPELKPEEWRTLWRT